MNYLNDNTKRSYFSENPLKNIVKGVVVILLFTFTQCSLAQVGVGNTNPQATLDISATNATSPADNDGILIPRMSAFPSTPGATRDGMLIFYTGTGASGKGFYYWNNSTSSWVFLSSGSKNTLDEAYDEGGSGAGRIINVDSGRVTMTGSSEMLYLSSSDMVGGHDSTLNINSVLNGNTESGISIGLWGTNPTSSPYLGTSNAIYNYIRHSTVNGITTGLNNSFVLGINSGNSPFSTGFRGVLNDFYSITNANGKNIGIENLFSRTSNRQIGIENYFRASATLSYGVWNHTLGGLNSEYYGVYNQLDNITGTSNTYGVRTTISGSSTGTKYGSYIDISSSSNGIHYGIYSSAPKTNSYAGYFRGRMSLGTGTTNRYLMPETDGSSDQIIKTDGSGQLSFVDASTLFTNTDDQNLNAATLTGTILNLGIENGTGTSVNLASLQDGTGTDNQNLNVATLTGTTLNLGIENGTGTSVNLASLQDGTGTDNQTIDTFSFNNSTSELTLEIENDGIAAQTVDLSGLTGGNTLDEAYDKGGAGNGKNITADNGAVRINGTDGFLVTGSLNSGNTIDTEISGLGIRMFFNPRKAVFRSGFVNGTQWDDTNLGYYSFASGSNTIASGTGSIAMGGDTTASGNYSMAVGLGTGANSLGSIAMGGNTSATGTYSFAIGYESTTSDSNAMALGTNAIASNLYAIAIGNTTTASGNSAIALGRETTASGNTSTAFGNNSTASGDYSTAFGRSVNATASYSVAFGYLNIASGSNSTAFGLNTEASGYTSTAFGSYNTSPSFGETTLGLYATTYVPNSAFTFNNSDRLFTIGNGSDILSRSNALTIYKNGLMNINDEYNMPLTDGSNGQVMTTDGSGNVSFVDANTLITDEIDWYEESTTTKPNNINDDIYTLGYVAIGKNTANYSIDVQDTSAGITRGININKTDNSGSETSGLYITKTGSGTGRSHGVFTDVTGSGTGQKYGLFNRITSSANGSQYGTRNFINGNTGSNQFGTFNNLANDGTGDVYGTYNGMRVTSPMNMHGVYNEFNTANSGSTLVTGVRNRFTDGTPGSDGFAGLYTDFDIASNGIYYGVRNEYSAGSSGTGTKYGSYNLIPSGAGGTHYGVYSLVTKSNSYAGYFLGRVSVGTTTANNYILPASRGTNGQVIQTDGSGNVSWANVGESTTASNGLNEVGNDIRLGGTLTEDTTITYGNFDTRFNLSNNGDFIIQDNGTGVFLVNDAGDSVFGRDTYWRDENTGGTILAQMLDDGDDARFILRENGNINVDLDTNTGYVFNEQGLDRDFRIESDTWLNIFRVDAGNNRVGIGTASPDYLFSVNGTANLMEDQGTGAALRVQGDEALWYDGTRFSWGFGGTSNTFADDVGIGMTAVPTYRLDVRDNNATNYAAQIYNTNTGTNADGLRIQLGVAAPNTNNIFIGFRGSTNLRGSVRGNGTGVVYNTTSDRRLKTNIGDINNSLELIEKIQPRIYEYKEALGIKEYGFIAQELQPFYPQAVSGSPDSNVETDPMMVDYGRLTPILAAGIKELKAEVEELKTENNMLKAKLQKLEALEARLTALENNTGTSQTSTLVSKE